MGAEIFPSVESHVDIEPIFMNEHNKKSTCDETRQCDLLPRESYPSLSWSEWIEKGLDEKLVLTI
jgi:hypothetical protein